MKRIFMVLSIVLLSFTLISCQDNKPLDVKEELSGVTLKKDAIVENKISVLTETTVNSISNKQEINATMISSKEKDFVDFSFKNDASLGMGLTLKQEVVGKVYNVNDNNFYLDLNKADGLGEILAPGKYKVPTDAEFIPEDELEFDIDEIFSDEQFIKFVAEFKGAKIIKKGKTLNVEILLNKETLILNIGLINEIFGNDENLPGNEDDLIGLINDMKVLNVKLAFAVTNKQLDFMNLDYDIEMADEAVIEEITVTKMKATFSLKYVKQMPVFPNFTDFKDMPLIPGIPGLPVFEW